MTNPDVHIAIINLPRATARREAMKAEMEQAGLDVQFSDAVDLSQISEADLLRDCAREGPWGVFQNKDMACTLSHARTWEAFLASDAQYLLVFEDDVFVSPELADWLADLSWWPEGADIVKLERWLSPRKKVVLELPGIAFAGRNVARLLSRHSGGAGYLLTRRAAERLLAHKPFPMCVDQLLFNPIASPAARELDIFQIIPALVQQGTDPDQSAALADARHRPKGRMLLRQKIVRGWNEIAYPLSTVFKLITGRATLMRVPYAAKAYPDGLEPTGTSSLTKHSPVPPHGTFMTHEGSTHGRTH